MSAFGEGAPCWAELSLSDMAAGQRFYGELLGWTFEDQGEQYGHYTTASRDGKGVAGLMAKTGPPEPAGWSLYLATADAAKTTAKVTEAGGRVLSGPDAAGDLGVMTGAVDPGGSHFGLWQPGSHPGFGLVNEPGAFCWTENHTQDPEAVDAFYSALFGYEAQQIGDGVHFDYKVWTIPGGKDPVAGRMKATDDTPSAFQIYYVVADCDDAAATVRRLGGQVVAGPDDSPFGRTAVVADDQGARFAVIDTERRSGGGPGPGE
jgi:predicted enzyme related to lactoylglutathione lyase